MIAGIKFPNISELSRHLASAGAPLAPPGPPSASPPPPPLAQPQGTLHRTLLVLYTLEYNREDLRRAIFVFQYLPTMRPVDSC